MAFAQRIVVDGEEIACVELQIQPYLPLNPAAAPMVDLCLLTTCLFDVRGRAADDESFSFFDLRSADNDHWPPTVFN